MIRYIIMTITALLLTNCTSKRVVETNSAADNNDKAYLLKSECYQDEIKYNPKGILTVVIPISCLVLIPSECFDEQGLYQPNRGHDSLDCDNL